MSETMDRVQAHLWPRVRRPGSQGTRVEYGLALPRPVSRVRASRGRPCRFALEVPNPVDTIYADYQATTPVDPRIVDIMHPFWHAAFGNPHSHQHAIGWRAAQAVARAQTSIARLIGADPDEIIFTSGATEANNLAILGACRRGAKGRKRLWVSAIEHKCVLEAARRLAEREIVALDVIPVDRNGAIDLEFLRAQLDDSVCMVSVMGVNNEIGTIQDIPALADMLAPYDVMLHCDAAQAPSALDISAWARYADLISLSAHKMYGPQGIGALYVRRERQPLIEPLLYGGGQQNGLRSGTIPLPLCAGMGAAAEMLSAGEQEVERTRVAALRDRFVARLRAEAEGVSLIGPSCRQRHPGSANLLFQGVTAGDLLDRLQPRLAASTGAACTTGLPEPSHVLRAIGLSGEEADSAIRFSFGRFTTEAEIDAAVGLVKNVLGS